MKIIHKNAFPVLMILAACFFAGCRLLPSANQNEERPERIARYRQEAERLRGLPLANKVAIAKESRADLLSMIKKELEKPDNRAFLDDSELLLRSFRVLNPDDRLSDIYGALMKDQIAAYYDSESKRLVYVDENADMLGKKFGKEERAVLERFVYVHEFCHAVEDSHFDLENLLKTSMSTLDRNLAATSFAEGNAVLAGADGVMDAMGVPANTAAPLPAWFVSMLGHVDVDETAEGLEQAPPFLAGALLRPYIDGTVFSNRLRRDAGWRAIDAAYADKVPLTTAEIAYPERRYLKSFAAAEFEPDEALFAAPCGGVVTNSLGVMGIALWLGGERARAPADYGFLKGWFGDRVYLLKDDAGGAARVVWLSYWERPGMARAFRRRVGKRLKNDFGEAQWRVSREGRLVAAVWDASGTKAGGDMPSCGETAETALRTKVRAATPARLWSWLNDLPWPLRFPHYPGHSGGFELLGGYACDLHSGDAFFRWSLLGGGAWRVESNADRHYGGLLWGLAKHVKDERSDFTYWKLPVLASWHRRGGGEGLRYRWSLLWGLLADGSERRARVLFVPVWRESQ
ncbi:MAG: hypothetical protein PHG96_08895 [Kiritimatiellae bacterium]|nr:hypothetical protein [Kiritimatiellia bacterium]